MNNNKIHSICVLGATMLLLAFFMPVLILGQGVHILIHDNLDSVFLNIKVLIDGGMLWAPSSAIVDTYNVPRLALGTQFNVIPYLFLLFGPFAGYVVNILILKLVAFIGMYLLMKKTCPSNGDRGTIVLTYALAVCFATLPYFSLAGLSVAGLPIAVYALLNFYQRTQKWSDWTIIIILPFYSSLLYSFLFLLIFFGLFFLSASIKERRVHAPLFWALATMSALFILVEYRLFMNILDPVFTPQRAEYVKEGLTFSKSWKEARENFFNGQYHVPTNHKALILPFIMIYMAWSIYRKDWKSLLFKIASLCLFLSLAISLFYGLWDWSPVTNFRDKISFLKEFNLTRFHWLHPLLWYTGFGAAAFGFYRTGPHRTVKYVVILLVLFQCSSNFLASERYEFMNNAEPGSYREFTATSQFKAIAKTIGRDKNKYRIASIGIHPSITAYNGYRTIDFYMAYYPLTHKKDLYDVMKNELKRDPLLEKYFLDWGNRAYLFTAKTGKQFLSSKATMTETNTAAYKPAFDNKKLRDMGASFLVSRIKLSGYKLLGTFPAQKGQSLETLYLYEL